MTQSPWRVTITPCPFVHVSPSYDFSQRVRSRVLRHPPLQFPAAQIWLRALPSHATRTYCVRRNS
jgi:hypothetical protein